MSSSPGVRAPAPVQRLPGLARILWRAPLLLAGTLGLWGLWLVLALPARLLGRGQAWRARVLQAWSRFSLRSLGVRVEVAGSRPRGGFLLVANHLSYVDVLVLASELRCAFVAKAEIARWPLVGLLARSMGTLFVDRARKRELGSVAERMAARLRAGCSLVLFPEGTSTAGQGVETFRSSLLQPAAELGLPVRYAVLHYATPPTETPAAESVAWWGDAAFLPHLTRLLALPGFVAGVVFGQEPIVAPNRKLLAARLQRAVSAHFVPLRAS